MNDKKLDIAVSELENFVQGRVWRIIVAALTDRVGEKMEENNVLDPFNEPVKIARNQGFVEAMAFVVDYPAILKEQVEFENREEKKDGKE